MKIKLLSNQHSIANNQNNNYEHNEDETLFTENNDEVMDRHFTHVGSLLNRRRRSSGNGRSSANGGQTSSLDVLHDF